MPLISVRVLTVLDDKVIQLTWKAKQGFVYDKQSLEMQKSFPFEASQEGWGLCNDGSDLYKSDGSNRIWTLDGQTYKERGNIQVMTHKTALKKTSMNWNGSMEKSTPIPTNFKKMWW